ncbi:MAG TPA: ACP S-malonyltransferase [Clostridiales bacterium]|nr:ACP S-malonyltransferase [Clostridiales bacterium]
MSKIGFVFSGQGSQYIGMGKDLYENFESSREVFDKASEYINFDLKGLCFNGTKEALDITENTQPAIVAMSLSAYKAISEYDVYPDFVAGLSLGEYSALTVSGAFSLEDVIPLVRKRGKFMQEAVPTGVGTMVAVLKASQEEVSRACNEASSEGIIEIANYNCPGQIVIGGENSAVDKAVEILKVNGARVIPLAVSAPFHTSMLKPAAIKLKKEMDIIEIGEIKIPIVANVNARIILDSSKVKDLLYNQVMKSVLWEQSVRLMIDKGVTEFIEIGPGKTLSGLIKKINKEVNVYNVENMTTLENTVSKLKTL